MSTQFAKWWTLVNFPKNAKAALGFGAEYWISQPTHYEGWEQLRDRYKALNRHFAPRDIAYELSGNLLNEVIVAAGGVEIEVERLRTNVESLKLYAARHQMQATPGIPFSFNHDAATDAWYAFSNVLSWSRTLVERVERRAEKPKLFPNQGLLPALKPKRLQKRCKALFVDLRASPVGQARPLSNFMLHVGLLNHPFSGVRLTPSGAIVLPIPDAPNRSIPHWYLFSWADQRDGVVLANQMWDSVQQFVNGVIEAFEKSVPKRLRK